MRLSFLIISVMSAQVVIAQDHSAHQHDTEAIPAAATSVAGNAAHDVLLHEHGGMPTALLLGERLEYMPELDREVWEAQGWYGTDLNKLWLKSEGGYDTREDSLEHAETQLLYSRAIAPYWDLQGGVRIDQGQGPRRHHAVLGLMGLAPYWFELDAAAFLSEQGDLSARLEAEYELRFTQRLILQPRLELNYAFAEDAAMGLGEGWSDVTFGLRLRYEWRRQLAPYVGVEYRASHGGTARLLQASDEDTEETTWLLGLRFWY